MKSPAALLWLAIAAAAPATAHAEIAVVASDNKIVMVEGVARLVPDAAPDTLSIIDLSNSEPCVVAEIAVPCSVVGPPSSVAVAPDASLALVTSAMRLDPDDPTRQIEDNRLTVVDLTGREPQIVATLETGRAPSGISINRQGTLALVANRGEGSVSIFTLAGKVVTAAGKLQVGPAASGVSHVAIAPDGRSALVTRDGDHTVSLLAIDGAKVGLASRDIRPGLRPYAADISRDGRVAVTANAGFGNGDIDTVGVIDLRADPPRLVDVIPVGATPEGIKLSPDGALCAVVVQNGTNQPVGSPWRGERGRLLLFSVDGPRLSQVAEIAVGAWPQGVAFAADSRTLLVANMVEHDIQVLRWDGAALRDTGRRLTVGGGPVAIRTPEVP